MPCEGSSDARSRAHGGSCQQHQRLHVCSGVVKTQRRSGAAQSKIGRTQRKNRPNKSVLQICMEEIAKQAAEVQATTNTRSEGTPWRMKNKWSNTSRKMFGSPHRNDRINRQDSHGTRDPKEATSRVRNFPTVEEALRHTAPTQTSLSRLQTLLPQPPSLEHHKHSDVTFCTSWKPKKKKLATSDHLPITTTLCSKSVNT